MAVFGALPMGSALGISSVLIKADGGATFALGDSMKQNGSGKISVAAAGDAILGIALQAGTSSTVGAVLDITPGMIVVMDSSSASTVAANRFQGASLTGTTGIQTIDHSTFGSGTQFVMRDFNPTSYGAVNSTGYTAKAAYLVNLRTFSI